MTTKVHNGSAKTTSGLSLNDTQIVGPTVQNDLFSILFRFRQHKYVTSADIEKMYRKTLVRTKDRKFEERILWRSNRNMSIKYVRMKYRHLWHGVCIILSYTSIKRNRNSMRENLSKEQSNYNEGFLCQ